MGWPDTNASFEMVPLGSTFEYDSDRWKKVSDTQAARYPERDGAGPRTIFSKPTTVWCDAFAAKLVDTPSTSRALVYETYQCANMDGTTEYGYTFKREGSEDTEFDLVVGSISHRASVPDAISAYTERMPRYLWAAEAIVKAAKEQGK
jgi:hypothetical protein